MLAFLFRLSIHDSAAKIQPDKVVQWCQSGNFLRPAFSVSRVQHISDMHSKFALRPRRVWKYGRPLRLDEEKKKKNIETTGQKYNGLPYYIISLSVMEF